MRTAKLVTGILCMVLFIFVVFQSCAAGTYNALEGNGEAGGTAGVLLAAFMLAGGIVQVAARSSQKRGGEIACAILFVLAALVGFLLAGSYGDLNIWAGWCLVLAVLNIVSATTKKTGSEKKGASE